MFNVEGTLGLENCHFSTIMAKIGLGRNYQLMLKQEIFMRIRIFTLFSKYLSMDCLFVFREK